MSNNIETGGSKVLTVLGARPQFVKASALSRVFGTAYPKIREIIVHTGQHHDAAMSDVFFDELGIPEPKYNLGVSGGLHGAMTGRMIEKLEEVILQESPDLVIVYGDTNSTLAGALAARKLNVSVAHVEAGLRSYNMRMPEEINRILTDRISDLLFCPTKVSQKNLINEGQLNGLFVGDVMLDVAQNFSLASSNKSTILAENQLIPDTFLLATCHRADTSDTEHHLVQVLSALKRLSREFTVVLPLHPRTKRKIGEFGLSEMLNNVVVLEPQPYLNMVSLEMNAVAILTDSGGVQKEAYFFGVPCITFRSETEWVETVASGWNRLVRIDSEEIFRTTVAAIEGGRPPERPNFYGDGHAAELICKRIATFLG